MPHEPVYRQVYLDRVVGAVNEFSAAQKALGWFIRASSANLKLLAKLANKEDVEKCLTNLESTYIIRLFSEFEAAMRDYWKDCRRRKSRPIMEILMNSTGTYLGITRTYLDNAHKGREYRNDLVHQRQSKVYLSINDCKSHLCTFISWLPVRWEKQT